jgi:hypothetical protein
MGTDTLTRKEIQEAVADPEWQVFRLSLKGLSTERKLDKLDEWLQKHRGERRAQVQVENYENALRRGGFLP